MSYNDTYKEFLIGELVYYETWGYPAGVKQYPALILEGPLPSYNRKHKKYKIFWIDRGETLSVPSYYLRRIGDPPSEDELG